MCVVTLGCIQLDLRLTLTLIDFKFNDSWNNSTVRLHQPSSLHQNVTDHVFIQAFDLHFKGCFCSQEASEWIHLLLLHRISSPACLVHLLYKLLPARAELQSGFNGDTNDSEWFFLCFSSCKFKELKDHFCFSLSVWLFSPLYPITKQRLVFFKGVKYQQRYSQSFIYKYAQLYSAKFNLILLFLSRQNSLILWPAQRKISDSAICFYSVMNKYWNENWLLC